MFQRMIRDNEILTVIGHLAQNKAIIKDIRCRNLPVRQFWVPCLIFSLRSIVYIPHCDPWRYRSWLVQSADFDAGAGNPTLRQLGAIRRQVFSLPFIIDHGRGGLRTVHPLQ